MPTGGQPGALGGALVTALAGQAAVVLAFAVLGALAYAVVQRRRAADPSGPALPTESGARRFLRVALGSLWVLDGLLQAQPAMPSGFLPTMVDPAMAGQPSWLTQLVAPLVRAWSHHPVGADAVTVWVQVGLGVLVLAGGSGRFARTALWASLGWSVVVWVAGEGLGGLLVPGASWLTGVPGAAVFYAVASGLLLAPWSWWSGRRPAATLARWAVGVTMLLGAVLQALPWEGAWSASDGLSAIFRDASTTPQPALLRRPLSALALVSAAHPVAVGSVLLVVLAVVGAGLVSGRAAWLFVPSGLAVLLATWWFGQDFGVLGGTGTDPNSAVPLAAMLVAAWPGWAEATHTEPERAPVAPRRRVLGGAAWGAGVAAVLVVPAVLALGLFGPADAQAAVADDGGVRQLDGRAAPDFTLTDQNGARLTLSKLRGNLVLLTFLDPVCSDNCPLIANQLAAAVRAAGARAEHVQVVAVDANPVFHGVPDVQTFTREHGLSAMPSWHFVTGSLAQLTPVLRSYGITVSLQSVGMEAHSQVVYFVDAAGREVSSMDDSAQPDLTTGYVDLMTRAIETRAP